MNVENKEIVPKTRYVSWTSPVLGELSCCAITVRIVRFYTQYTLRTCNIFEHVFKPLVASHDDTAHVDVCVCLKSYNCIGKVIVSFATLPGIISLLSIKIFFLQLWNLGLNQSCSTKYKFIFYSAYAFYVNIGTSRRQRRRRWRWLFPFVHDTRTRSNKHAV